MGGARAFVAGAAAVGAREEGTGGACLAARQFYLMVWLWPQMGERWAAAHRVSLGS